MSDATANESSATEPERGYVVDPNFVPNPTDRVGSFRTDTAGQANGVKGLASAFAVADRRSVLTAQRALDPDDRTVSENHVNVYPADTLGEHDREGVKARIEAKFEEIKDVLTDEDHVIVQNVRGFFKDGKETPGPKSDAGISTGPTEGPGVTDTVNTGSQRPNPTTPTSSATGTGSTGTSASSSSGSATGDNAATRPSDSSADPTKG